MYFYKFAYGSYEDSKVTTLFHEKQFTKEEFEWCCLESWISGIILGLSVNEHYRTMMPIKIMSFDHFYDDAIAHMINYFEFKEPKYEQSHYVMGWGCVFDQEDWSGANKDLVEKIMADQRIVDLLENLPEREEF